MHSCPLNWGQYFLGLDDDSNETLHELLGLQFCLFDRDMSGTGGGGGQSPKPRTNSVPTTVRLIRNRTGAALLPGELAKLKPTTADTYPGGSGAIPLLEAVSAKTSAHDWLVVCVDPYLPSAGVPDKGIFLAIFNGPTKCKLPAASGWTNGDIAVADPLIALGSGRIGKYDSTPADATAAQLEAISLIGYALETKAESGNESTLLRTYFRSPAF